MTETNGMSIDLQNALHLVDGDSAAGTLKVALRLDRHRLLVNSDPIHCGPAPATTDLATWRHARGVFQRTLHDGPWFREVYGDSERDFLPNFTRLREEGPVIVWVATGLHEQLLLAWLVFLFKASKLDLSRILVVQFERLRPEQRVRGIGELSPANIKEFSPQPRSLSADDIRAYLSAWEAYTSSDPSSLVRFLQHARCVDVLHRSMRRLVYRYPSLSTGLSHADEQLLNWVIKKGPSAVRVIGYALGYNESEDWLGDIYIFKRLLALGAPTLEQPLLSVSGDQSSMRRCQVEATDFGRRVLAGEVNAAKTNGVDDWIGGVHLHTLEGMLFRENDKLLIHSAQDSEM